MFLDLFYGLRKEGVPVSLQEWQGFLVAMQKGLHSSSLERFYHLGRTCLIKTETQFDAYDRVFLKVFRGIEGKLDGITDDVLKWLEEAKDLPELTPEQLAELEKLSSDELMKKFLERLEELILRREDTPERLWHLLAHLDEEIVHQLAQVRLVHFVVQ